MKHGQHKPTLSKTTPKKTGFLFSIHDFCDQFDYKATQKYYLQKHIASDHKRVVYSCDQCD